MELMVALAILAALVALAGPMVMRLLRSTAVSSAVNAFLLDVRFARSEAIRRGTLVAICRSDDPEASSPSCGSGTGPNSNGWVSGWVVFQDLDNDGVIDANESVLRVQGPIRSIDQIAEPSTVIRFTPNGRLTSAPSTTWTFGSSAYGTSTQRIVTLNLAGRPTVAKGDGSAP